jgi:hypothetical protein
MKHFLLIILAVILPYNVQSQSAIADHIAMVNIDSLVKTVRELSGEDSTYISGIKTIIGHRVNNTGNDLAADYISERLNQYGVNVTNQVYSAEGRNVIASQTGMTHPDSIVIVCAHYDAVAAYCADDNASGTAAVLEVARILSNYKFDLTIVYALWDEEEIGILGSKYYAEQAVENQQKIAGVINLEMLGYDGNSDNIFDIHTNNDTHSLKLKDSIITIISKYNLTLAPNVINPGNTESDHSSFWNEGYGAIAYGESFWGGDPNPNFHTANDRIDLFNLTYFEELSKLSVGITSTIAIPFNNFTSTYKNRYDLTEVVNIYPNPTTSEFYLTYPKEFTKVEVIDLNGNILKVLHSDKATFSINLSNFPNGLYTVVVYGKNEIITRKVIKK